MWRGVGRLGAGPGALLGKDLQRQGEARRAVRARAHARGKTAPSPQRARIRWAHTLVHRLLCVDISDARVAILTARFLLRATGSGRLFSLCFYGSFLALTARSRWLPSLACIGLAQAVLGFLRELPARKVGGVGSVTERMLKALGVECVGPYSPDTAAPSYSRRRALPQRSHAQSPWEQGVSHGGRKAGGVNPARNAAFVRRPDPARALHAAAGAYFLPSGPAPAPVALCHVRPRLGLSTARCPCHRRSRPRHSTLCCESRSA